MQWVRMILFEWGVIALIVFALRLIRMPAFLRRKKFVKGFPWGYYPDALPNSEAGYFMEDSESFLFNTGTAFEGVPGAGDLGTMKAVGHGEGYS